jgi:nucleoside-diphosphate-sugar epimerase
MCPGLVGGYIVLQLLARGTSPESIRILDIRETERSDLAIGPAAQVEFIKTDITSPESLDAAFSKPWSKSVAHLPLTVFHTAAVIVISERIKLFYRLPEAVNIHGTRNVLDAARKAGADIFSSTSSGSIAIRPISVWDSWWRSQPRDYLQFIDESDFDKPMRAHEEYFGNYAVSKADAERMVCGENEESFRTGCIRPANAVYGQQGDACFGRLLSLPVIPT